MIQKTNTLAVLFFIFLFGSHNIHAAALAPKKDLILATKAQAKVFYEGDGAEYVPKEHEQKALRSPQDQSALLAAAPSNFHNKPQTSLVELQQAPQTGKKAAKKEVRFASAEDVVLATSASKTLEKTQTAMFVGAQAHTDKFKDLYAARFPQGHAQEYQTLIKDFFPFNLSRFKVDLPKSRIVHAVWHPKGNQFSALSGSTAYIFDTKKRSTLHALEHEGTVEKTSWNNDGTLLVTTAKEKKEKSAENYTSVAHVWDASKGSCIGKFTFTGCASSVVFNPAGTQFVSADKDAHVWDVATGTETLTLPAAGGLPNARAWSPDGTQLATLTFGTNRGYNRDLETSVWDTQTGKKKSTHKTVIYAYDPKKIQFDIRWKPDGTRLAFARKDYDYSTVLDLKADKDISVSNRVAWNQKGEFAIDPTRPSAFHHHAVPAFAVFSSESDALDFNKASWLASIAWDKAQYSLEHQTQVSCAAWNHDATRLATTADQTVSVFDTQTRERLYAVQYDQAARSVSWNHDKENPQLAVATDNTTHIFDLTSPTKIISGNVSLDQALLMALFADWRKKYPSRIPISLKKCASQINAMMPTSSAQNIATSNSNKKMITTADLAQILLTLEPWFRETLLARHNLHTKRERLNTDETQEDYLIAYQAFERARAIIPNVGTGNAGKILEEYMVDAHQKVKEINNVAAPATPQTETKQQQEQKDVVSVTKKVQAHQHRTQHLPAQAAPTKASCTLPTVFAKEASRMLTHDKTTYCAWNNDGTHLVMLTKFTKDDYQDSCWFNVSYADMQHSLNSKKEPITTIASDTFDNPEAYWNSQNTHIAILSRSSLNGYCRRINIVDIARNRKAHCDLPQSITHMTWNKDGNHLAAATCNMVYLLNASAHIVQKIPISLENTTHFIWNDEGTKLAILDNGKVFICCPAAKTYAPLAYKNPVSSITWGADDALIVVEKQSNSPDAAQSAHSIDHSWDSVAGLEIQTLKHPGVVSNLVWNQSKTRLATITTDNAVHLWDATSCMKFAYALPHESGTAIAWSPDNTRFATHLGNTVIVWDALSGSVLHTLDHQYTLKCFSWSPNGTQLATASVEPYSKEAYVWDVASGEKKYTLYPDQWDYTISQHPICTFHWSADGTQLAGQANSDQDKNVRVFDMARQQFFEAVETHDLKRVNEHLVSHSKTHRYTIDDARIALIRAISFGRSQSNAQKAVFERILFNEVRLRNEEPPIVDEFHLFNDRLHQLINRDEQPNVLIIAINQGCFNYALQIAQIIDQEDLLPAIFAHGGNLAYRQLKHMETHYKNDPDFQKLLQLLEKHKEIEEKKRKIAAELRAYKKAAFYDGDAQKNTPLIIAIKEKRFGDALLIAQVMDDKYDFLCMFPVAYDNEGTAYDIAKKIEAEYAQDSNFQKLMKILEKNHHRAKAAESSFKSHKKIYTNLIDAIKAMDHVQLLYFLDTSRMDTQFLSHLFAHVIKRIDQMPYGTHAASYYPEKFVFLYGLKKRNN